MYWTNTARKLFPSVAPHTVRGCIMVEGGLDKEQALFLLAFVDSLFIDKLASPETCESLRVLIRQHVQPGVTL